MTLDPPPFETINNGTKTIELRLNDEKRQLIRINDEIIFENKADRKNRIAVRVTNLFHFKSFEELYDVLPLLKCGYTEENIHRAKPEDMEKFYSKEQQEKYGVLGIEIEKTELEKLKNFDIRPMKTDDYEQVYSLWQSCSGMGLNNLDDSKEGIERFLNRNPDTCFVAETSNKIIGAILAGNDGRRGYIYHAAVSPDYQNRGVGKQLVNRAVDALSQIGINKVALVVFGKNTSGNAFWKRLGFTERNDLIYRNKTLNAFERMDT